MALLEEFIAQIKEVREEATIEIEFKLQTETVPKINQNWIPAVALR